MSEFDKTFLGTGWSFPPTFLKEKKGVVMISDIEDINSSLEILLSTQIRERVMQPEYGCDLKDFLFEPINLSFITFMETLVKDAIVRFEPRINLLGISLEPEPLEGKVTITVEYEVRGTNSRFNFVFPYYLEEGSEING